MKLKHKLISKGKWKDMLEFKTYKKMYPRGITPADEGELAVKFENWGWKPRKINWMLKKLKSKKYR